MMRSLFLRPLRPVSLPACRQMSIGQRMRDKNTALRERSEAALEKRRTLLGDDWKNHQERILELRAAIRIKEPFTLHPPPVAFYSSTEAFYFPPTEVRALSGRLLTLGPADMFKGKLSVVGCAGSRFSEAMVNDWLNGIAGGESSAATGRSGVPSGEGSSNAATAAAPSPACPDVQILRLGLVEGLVLRLLQWPLLWSMRTTVPSENRDSFFLKFGSSMELRHKLRFDNRYLGYVCVVDEEGAVRWHVHSNEAPTQKQIEALRNALIRR